MTGDDGTDVLRAEPPGTDPGHDIGITVDGGLITVTTLPVKRIEGTSGADRPEP
ncbi:hypothetical protein [Streptomyces sp. NBC_01216]|uniref:hypothetical protein n=1 Tax=unclassified Streptomyces TaxID=2593676 RepID=UPI002E10288F|nr:hypothetical protein OG393_29545 [Streptomyces sp. NBC_01216]